MKYLEISLTDDEYRMAQCWVGDIEAWLAHALANKLRKLKERTLRNELARENPEWSLDRLLPDPIKVDVRKAMTLNIFSPTGANLLEPDTPLGDMVLENMAFPTRHARDANTGRR